MCNLFCVLVLIAAQHTHHLLRVLLASSIGDKEEVNKPPYPWKDAAGEDGDTQLADAHAYVANHETVDTELTEDNGDDEDNGGVV